VLSPLQSARALRLHRLLRRRHVVHRLCARPTCARTGAQQRPWREVHCWPASGAAGVSGRVPVNGKSAGTRVRGEATYSRAEGRAGRQCETTPPLKPGSRKQLKRAVAAPLVLTRWPGPHLATAASIESRQFKQSKSARPVAPITIPPEPIRQCLRNASRLSSRQVSTNPSARNPSSVRRLLWAIQIGTCKAILRHDGQGRDILEFPLRNPP
jgi:hypothetical protein